MPPRPGAVERRVIARVEASDRGTRQPLHRHQPRGTPRWLYEVVYCARGQAENLVKAHKLHLASDRTSCTKATANQFRLVLHTAAYWLLHTLRGLAPKRSFWREAQFDTLRLALIKVAARVTELATRIKLALPSSYPYRDSLTLLAARAATAALSRGAACPARARPSQPPAPDHRASGATARHGRQRDRRGRPHRSGELLRVSFPAACGVNLYSRPKDAVMRSGQYPAPWGGEVY